MHLSKGEPTLPDSVSSTRSTFLPPFFSYLIYFTGKREGTKGNRDGMEIFPSLDRNRKTTLFTRPSSRGSGGRVEDAGHVQHGAITRSFRFFHLPPSPRFLPTELQRQTEGGALLSSFLPVRIQNCNKGGKEAHEEERRAGQIEAEESKRALILPTPILNHPSTLPLPPIFRISIFISFFKRTLSGSARGWEDTLRALQLTWKEGREGEATRRISRRASFTFATLFDRKYR